MTNTTAARILAMSALIGAASMSFGNNVSVLTREEGRASGYRMGRRSRPEPAQGGYPGAKLAKKARKGTLTLCRIR
jgi:hypothetical protein